MLTPVAKRILIQGIEEQNGTILVHNAKPKKFKVFAVGNEVTQVKAGDVIFLEKHYGIEIDHNKDKFTVIDESSILAKIVD